MKKEEQKQYLIDMMRYDENLGLYKETEQMNVGAVSSSCPCGVPYVETKKSDIPYDTDDNVYYTDILIHHCPKCGNIDRIDEY